MALGFGSLPGRVGVAPGPWPRTASWRRPCGPAAVTPLQSEALGILVLGPGNPAVGLRDVGRCPQLHPPRAGQRGALLRGVRLREVTLANEVL